MNTEYHAEVARAVCTVHVHCTIDRLLNKMNFALFRKLEYRLIIIYRAF